MNSQSHASTSAATPDYVNAQVKDSQNSKILGWRSWQVRRKEVGPLAQIAPRKKFTCRSHCQVCTVSSHKSSNVHFSHLSTSSFVYIQAVSFNEYPTAFRHLSRALTMSHPARDTEILPEGVHLTSDLTVLMATAMALGMYFITSTISLFIQICHF